MSSPASGRSDEAPPLPLPTELSAEELRFQVSFPTAFQTTAELEPPDHDLVGQERAQAALDLGLGIAGSGFHIFVSGMAGAQKLDVVHDWVAQQARHAPTPGDWVYVHNFADPDVPQAIGLPTGHGVRLKARMAQLVKSLREELPKAFREEAFDRERDDLKEKYLAQAQALNASLETRAKDKGFLLQMSPQGMILIPVVNGQPLKGPEEFQQLAEDQQAAIEHKRRELLADLADFPRQQRDIMRAMAEDIRQVEQRFCENVIAPHLAAIGQEIHSPAVAAYLEQVKRHTVEHLDAFKEPADHDGSPSVSPAPGQAPVGQEQLYEYEVNIVVDNAHTTGAPVLTENTPTYQNLFGSIERVLDRGGRLVTNFTRIKAGSMLCAHGGYLIFNLEDALTEPAVWKTLKRTLKSGRIAPETYEPFSLFSAAGLQPQPVAVQLKLIVVGSPSLYHSLYALDPEFQDLFKVHADFRHTLELSGQHGQLYGQWVGRLCRQENLPHFERSGVARLVEFGARRVGDREKVSAAYAEVADLVREAAYWAGKDEARLVTAAHVETALQQRRFRANRIEEELREMITRGTVLLDSQGKKVGQINGLAVLDIGGHSFGRPSRITASVGMGRAGIVNIERESRLSGSSHDKGLLILSGYLRNRFGQDKPLALSASLCFEQSYSGVDGDSASSTELYALLSRLAEVPLRQDLAVTGSVNQWGEVQAIGGANEKIEGFFDVCKAHGLTGQQGVLIPAANVRNLILRADVVRAVEDGRFHIYPVQTIDQGIELLSGLRAGSVDEPDTINGRVSRRLRELAEQLGTFGARKQTDADGAGHTDLQDEEKLGRNGD